MKKLYTVEKAKDQIEFLKKYIDLVESYEVSSIESKVIKEFALTNSCAKVAGILNKEGYRINGKMVSVTDVSRIIREKPRDELHRILRDGYMQKTKKSKSTY